MANCFFLRLMTGSWLRILVISTTDLIYRFDYHDWVSIHFQKTFVSRGMPIERKDSRWALYSERKDSRWALYSERKDSRWALYSERKDSRWALYSERRDSRWALYSPTSAQIPLKVAPALLIKGSVVLSWSAWCYCRSTVVCFPSAFTSELCTTYRVEGKFRLMFAPILASKSKIKNEFTSARVLAHRKECVV